MVFNNIFEGKTESLWLRIGMFLMGLGGSLIMENVMRLKTIRKEVEAGKQEVILKRLPFDSLMWVSSPTFDKFTERYKMFYNIPMEVDVVNEQI